MVPDYYAMLGVDPGADRAAIEAALARCQPAWSSGTRNPKTKHTFQSYLDQIPALRQTLLGDPGARLAYDAELAAARRAERDAKLDALQRLVRLRAAKGGLTVSDRALLRDEAVKLGLTTDDLDRLAEPIPLQPEVPVEDDPPDPPLDVLDPVTRRQIRVALEHLRRRDLYDALGLTHDAPAGEIGDRTDAERRRWMQKAQVTAEKTAWLEVVSLAQSHLIAPAAQARYDRTLGGRGRGDAQCLDRVRAEGSRPDRPGHTVGVDRRGGRARDRAGPRRPADRPGLPGARGGTRTPRVDFGRQRRLPAAPLPQLLGRDRVPPGGAGKKSPTCRHCRASLRWDCPACRTVALGGRGSLRLRLPPRGSRAPAGTLRRRSTGIQGASVRDGARAPAAGPGGDPEPRRRPQGDRPRPASPGGDRPGPRLRGRPRAGGQLVAARAAVEAWRRLADPSDPELEAAWNEVARGLRDAQALLARARDREPTDPAAARLLYRQALALAADLPEARSGLLRCPPDPPSCLVSEFVAGRVRLRWTPPVPDGLGPVSYVILRKQGGPFQHPRDGARIGAVTAPEFEDTAITPGATVSYAVLSERAGVESVAAVAVEPIFLLGEASDVRVTTASRSIDLAWTLPAGAVEVRLVRKVGSVPTSPKDGDRVEALRDRVHDGGLDDDRVYHYGLFAIYRLPDGRFAPSRGVFVSAQPHAPIAPLPAPALTHDHEGRVRLDWPEPARGTVKILRTPRALPMAPGDRLTAAAADALEGQWLDAEPGRAFDPAPPPLGVCHYTPLTVWAGAATVGHGVSYSCVPDPSDLRAARVGSGGRVHLRWRWSPQGNAIAGRRPGRRDAGRPERPRGPRRDRPRSRVQPPGPLHPEPPAVEREPLAHHGLQPGHGERRAGRFAGPGALGADGLARAEPRSDRLLRLPPPGVPGPLLVVDLPDRPARLVDPADRPGDAPPNRPALAR